MGCRRACTAGAAESTPRPDTRGQPAPPTPVQPPHGQPKYGQPQQEHYDPRYDRHDSDEYPAYGRHGYPGHKYRKRRSFLHDIFDFD